LAALILLVIRAKFVGAMGAMSKNLRGTLPLRCFLMSAATVPHMKRITKYFFSTTIIGVALNVSETVWRPGTFLIRGGSFARAL